MFVLAAVKPPKIVTPTKDTVAPENGPGKMFAKITGFPAPTVKWFLNDQELVESENIRFESVTKDNTYHMTLLNDLKEMTGTIKVVATNAGGSDSCQSNLLIRGRAPTFVEKPQKCTILEGGTLIFTTIIDGDPYPTVEWSKGKWSKLANDAQTRVYLDEESKQHYVEKDNIKPKDAGTYTVTIENEFGSDSCPATLMVTKDAAEAEDWAKSLKKT